MCLVPPALSTPLEQHPAHGVGSTHAWGWWAGSDRESWHLSWGSCQVAEDFDQERNGARQVWERADSGPLITEQLLCVRNAEKSQPCPCPPETSVEGPVPAPGHAPPRSCGGKTQTHFRGGLLHTLAPESAGALLSVSVSFSFSETGRHRASSLHVSPCLSGCLMPLCFSKSNRVVVYRVNEGPLSWGG